VPIKVQRHAGVTHHKSHHRIGGFRGAVTRR
jgi:arylsulfatase A-like enzyme